MKRAKLLLQTFPQSATDFVFFTDEKLFSVSSPDNRQNDSVYAPRDTRKCSIAAERLLRCCPTFSSMVSVAVSKLGCSPLFFVEPGVKVDGHYYRDVLLKHQMLPVMRRIAGDTYCTCSSRIAPQLTALATLSSYCSRRRQSPLHPTCGRQTAQT